MLKIRYCAKCGKEFDAEPNSNGYAPRVCRECHKQEIDSKTERPALLRNRYKYARFSVC